MEKYRSKVTKGNLGTLSGTEILTYPENVGEDPHQAHYIMFSIRKFIKGKFVPIPTGKMIYTKTDEAGQFDMEDKSVE